MNKYQRQQHRRWIPHRAYMGYPHHPVGYYVDRDPGDEHDADGVEEHREYLAQLAAEQAIR